MSVKVFEIHLRSRDMADLEFVFSWSNTLNPFLQYQNLNKQRLELAYLKGFLHRKFFFEFF